MQRKVQKYLWDMLDACLKIQNYTTGLSFEDYKSSDMTTSTVERKFEVIGEALKRVLELEPAIEEQIKGSRKIITFRNLLSHGYDILDYTVVWTVIKEDLPILIRNLQTLLNPQ